MEELKYLLEAVSDPRFKVVSFDLFDTLIRRDVIAPEHVLWLVGEEVAAEGDDPTLAQRFHDARLSAGMLALQRAQLDGKEEANLAEIYDTLACVLPQIRKRKAQAMQIEIAFERRSIGPYPLGVRLFGEAKKAGKRVVICSDQYLPLEFLEGLLKEFGLSGYEKFFLSGDLGIQKATGSLYEWMPIVLGVDRKEIVHIGDNQYVDVEVARRRGVTGLLLPRSDALAGHPGRVTAAARLPTLGSVATARYLNRTADERLAAEAPAPHDGIDYIGYTFYGPLLTYLAAWLAQPLRSGEIERLWFLARDGEGLIKVFGLLYPEYADRIDYAYASRRMLVYPTGTLTGVEIFRHYELRVASNPRVVDFLHDISADDVEFTSLSHYFQPDDRVNDFGVRPELQRRLDAHCAARRLDKGSSTLDRLRRYYLSLARGAKRIGMFDVGWRGNLQRAMESLFAASDLSFSGFYIGQIFESEIQKSYLDADCYAFSYNFPPDSFEDIIWNMWPLELIFGGTEPSTVDIAETSDGWNPVFERDNPSKVATRQIAARLQDGALRFVREAALADGSLIPKEFAVRRGAAMLREFLAHPGRCDAATLADLSWAMNIEDHGKPLIAQPKRTTGKAISRARSASSWPAGFDVLQSEENLRQMRQYWRRRENRHPLRRKLRARIRELFH